MGSLAFAGGVKCPARRRTTVVRAQSKVRHSHYYIIVLLK
jgi:hypothetical protein